jgi:hypothetical protein
VNGDQVINEEMLDEIMLLARHAGAGAAFRQLQRSEYQWHGLRTNYLTQLDTGMAEPEECRLEWS